MSLSSRVARKTKSPRRNKSLARRRLRLESLEDRRLLAVLFADSFEQSEWNGNWVEDGQNDWARRTQRASDGSYSAEVDGRASNATLSLANPLDLTSYGSAELTYSWYIESGFDSGEYIALDLYDGSSWTEVASLKGNVDQENVWHNETVTIDGSYLVSNFQLRFRSTVSRSSEDGFVDNVKIEGTLAGPPAISISDVSVVEGDTSIRFIDDFITAGSGGLAAPGGMVLGSDGNLYVANKSNDSVLRYDAVTGVFVDTFVLPGSGGLDNPHGLLFGPGGDLYVGRAGDGSVLRYDGTSGALIEPYVSAGSGGLDFPIGLLFDADGNLYVSSKDTDEVLRYGPASQAVFNVSLSSPSANATSIAFTTGDGTATAGSDYRAVSGTLVFEPGVTSRTIIVPTFDDLDIEGDQTFTVTLSNAVGTTIADGTGIGTILDNEFANVPPTVSAGVDQTVSDGDASGNQPVIRNGSNNNDWNGKWVADSQNDFFRSTQRSTVGVHSAEVDGRATNATLTTSAAIDISGYGSAELTFDWLIESGFDSGEYLSLDISTAGGASWTQNVRQLRGNVDAENVWHGESVDLSAYNSSDLKVRFGSSVSSSKEDANIDNVKIVGSGAAASMMAAPMMPMTSQPSEADQATEVPLDSVAQPFVVRKQAALNSTTVDSAITEISSPKPSGSADAIESSRDLAAMLELLAGEQLGM